MSELFRILLRGAESKSQLLFRRVVIHIIKERKSQSYSLASEGSLVPFLSNIGRLFPACSGF